MGADVAVRIMRGGIADIAGVDVVVGEQRTSGSRGLLSRRTVDLPDRVTSMVVGELVGQLGLPYARERRRLVVGTSRGAAEPGDVVWGDGAAAGSPLLLLGGLRPELVVRREARSGAAVVLEASASAQRDLGRSFVDPTGRVEKVLRRIAASDLAIASTVEVVAIAEALGVPARAVGPDDDSSAAFADYYTATGREGQHLLVSTVEEALELRGVPAPVWSPYPLLESFPAGLWGGDADPTMVAAIGWRVRLATEAPEPAAGEPALEPSSDGDAAP